MYKKTELNNREEKIEQYIRHPQTLAENERSTIQKWIDTDPVCKQIAEWYEKFYTLVDEPTGLNRLKPFSIHLVPFEALPHTPDRRFVLAAMSPTSVSPQIDTVMTYVSEQKNTILRVLNNYGAGSLDLHVISPHLADDEPAILFVPEKQMHLVTNPGGRLSLPVGEPWSTDDLIWKNCEVSLPVATLKLKDLMQQKEIMTGHTLKILVTNKEKKISVLATKPDGTPDNCKLLVHTSSGKLPKLFITENRKATFTVEKAEKKECTISFFY